MPLGRGLSASEMKFFNAASGMQTNAGSTAALNLSGFEYATVVAALGSAASATTFNVERATASGGAFGQMGCSLVQNASGIAVRTFKVGSPVYHKVSWSQGNWNGALMVIGQQPRTTPVVQDGSVTSYQTVLS